MTERQLNISFMIALLVLIAIGGTAVRSMSRFNELEKWVMHTSEVLGEIKESLVMLQEVELGARGFMLSAQEGYVERTHFGVEGSDEVMKRLGHLISDNPKQQEQVSKLIVARQTLVDSAMSTLRLPPAALKRHLTTEAAAERGKENLRQIRTIVKTLEVEEGRLMNERLSSARLQARTLNVILIGGSVFAFILIGLATVLMNINIAKWTVAEGRVVKINRQLEVKIAEYQVANKELETFSYSVSHDLRAPLRAIIGFSEILLEDHGGALVDAAKANIFRVIAAAERMGLLVDGLLNLSRLTRKEIVKNQVNLSDLARSILEELQARQPARCVVVTIAGAAIVEGDPQLLRAALENLLGNSWKFTAGREVAKIEFGIAKLEKETAYFVRDNGVGFDMKYVGKLFGAFQRLHRASEFEGTGIGLATVHRIVLRHGGRVWAQSALDEGATFYFTV